MFRLLNWLACSVLTILVKVFTEVLSDAPHKRQRARARLAGEASGMLLICDSFHLPESIADYEVCHWLVIGNAQEILPASAWSAVASS
eukprot:1161662-Pelagomonas_calceolata.AAC.23